MRYNLRINKLNLPRIFQKKKKLANESGLDSASEEKPPELRDDEEIEPTISGSADTVIDVDSRKLRALEELKASEKRLNELKSEKAKSDELTTNEINQRYLETGSKIYQEYLKKDENKILGKLVKSLNKSINSPLDSRQAVNQEEVADQEKVADQKKGVDQEEGPIETSQKNESEEKNDLNFKQEEKLKKLEIQKRYFEHLKVKTRITEKEFQAARQRYYQLIEEEYSQQTKNQNKLDEDESKKDYFNTDISYRENLEKIKIKEGNVQKSEYRSLERVSQDLATELDNLSDSLIAQKLDKNLNQNLQDLADKTGLTPEAIKEIYQTQEQSLVAEAKAEINKNTGTFKKIGIALGKSGIYVGAGVLSTTSTIASLGIGVGIGIGIIAGARILDRLVTEGRLKKKLDIKVREIKASKTTEDKVLITQHFAAAISLKKQMEISKVNLEEGGHDRDVIIDQYVDKYVDKHLPCQPIVHDSSDILKYKDSISRALKGLDDIDRSNTRREEKINQVSFFDRIKKIEDKISGTNVREKTVSTSVFIGLGIAARELPVIRQIMMAYAGYRVGALAGDYALKRFQDKKLVSNGKDILLGEESESQTIDIGDRMIGRLDRHGYNIIREKLLDNNFQQNNPEEYLKLKKQINDYEDYLMLDSVSASTKPEYSGIETINSDFEKELESKLKSQSKELRGRQSAKIAFRLTGALVGFLAGNVIGEVARNFKNNQTNHGASLNHHIKAVSVLSKKSGEINIKTGANINAEKIVGASSPKVVPSGSAVVGHAGPTSTTLNQKSPSDVIPVNHQATVAPQSEVTHLSSNSQGANKSVFEDNIFNVGLKPGQHDSVWRSTNQIFKDHAQELGYKGSLKDPKALEAWSQHQTGNALRNTQNHINASGNPGRMNDKVFEGNKILLEKNSAGGYRVKIEKADGLAPGHLKSEIPHLSSKNPQMSINSLKDIPGSQKNEELFNTINSHLPETNSAFHSLPSDIQGKADLLYNNNLITKRISAHHLDRLIEKIKGEALTRDQKILVRNFHHSGDLSKERFDALIGHIMAVKQNQHSSYTTTDILNTIKANQAATHLTEHIQGIAGTTKVFNSVHSLTSLPNNTEVNLGNLKMVKGDGVYNFTAKNGHTFSLLINNKYSSNSANAFDIRQNNLVLGKFGDSRELQQVALLKKSIYDNLPNKKSSFAVKLLKDIQSNK